MGTFRFGVEAVPRIAELFMLRTFMLWRLLVAASLRSANTVLQGAPRLRSAFLVLELCDNFVI